MKDADANPITLLLERWKEGDPSAERQLFDLLYAELKQLAGRLMRAERSDHTLQPTALVHEAYLRLVPAAVDCAPQTRLDGCNASTPIAAPRARSVASSDSRVLTPPLTWLVVGSVFVMAAARFVPFGAVQFYFGGAAGIAALWPLAYQMWKDAEAAQL